jgi:signal transduction histidine kinase/CheY-like chemotaxis protein
MGIQTRFMLYFGAVVITLMACVTLLVGQRQSRSLLSQTEQRGVAIANSIAGLITNSLLSYDLMGLQSAAQNAKDTTGASYVIILNKEHQVAGFSDRPELQLTALEDGLSLAIEASDDVHVSEISDDQTLGVGGEHLDISAPVLVGDGNVRWGTIRVGLPLLPLQAELANTRLLLILLGAVAIFIVLFAARYFTSRITRPLRGLAEATSAIASGDLDHAVDENLVGELRDLSRSFNKMTMDLKRSRDAIRYQNQHLENMVQERTAALREKARELERANAELMEVDRLKSDFLSNVSHELRTPLTSIRSFTEIMLDRTMNIDDDERFEFLDIVSNQAQRLTRLISDLLDLSKIEAGEFTCHLETLSVQDFLEPVRDTLGSLAYEKDIQLILGKVDDLPNILGDHDRLSQVLTNLIENALKFTPAGGRVAIGACLSEQRIPEESADLFHGIVCDTPEAGEYIIISVSDTGVGIAPTDQQRIFDKFGQVGNVLTDKPQGTGLGLAISGNIMVQHGGAIWVESDLGHGSTFSFSAPVTRARAGPRSHSNGSSSRDPAAATREIEGTSELVSAVLEYSEGRRILIVDDEREMVMALTDLLEPEGYRVLACHSGGQAVSKTRDLRPDLIILDINMPEINGYDVLRLLKGEAQTAAIPIIVLSGEQDTSRALALGAATCLPRPDLSSQLFAIVRTTS